MVVCTFSLVWVASLPLVCSRQAWWPQRRGCVRTRGICQRGGSRSLRSSRKIYPIASAEKHLFPQEAPSSDIFQGRVSFSCLCQECFRQRRDEGTMRCSKTSPLLSTSSPRKTKCFLLMTAMACICTPGCVPASVKLPVAEGSLLGCEGPHLKTIANPAKRGGAVLSPLSGRSWGLAVVSVVSM